jgi:hypothetical protein
VYGTPLSESRCRLNYNSLDLHAGVVAACGHRDTTTLMSLDNRVIINASRFNFKRPVPDPSSLQSKNTRVIADEIGMYKGSVSSDRGNESNGLFWPFYSDAPWPLSLRLGLFSRPLYPFGTSYPILRKIEDATYAVRVWYWNVHSKFIHRFIIEL